jgi:KaiC/GvpD/RAD55 family RecA-like ATPase
MSNKKSAVILRPLKTRISLVHSFERENEKFLPAKINLEGDKTGAAEEISWFDKLFEGGLRLPEITSNRAEDGQNIKPITMLIMGPPGSGKSTLAMEICYRLALPKMIDPTQANEEENREFTNLSSLYISLDTESQRILDKADNFGWSYPHYPIWDIYSNNQSEYEKPPMIQIWGKDHIWRDSKNQEQKKFISEITEDALTAVSNIVIKAAPTRLIDNLGKAIRVSNHPADKIKKNFKPDILVIDSLNIMRSEDQGDYFEQFLEITEKGPRLVIYILDTNSSDTKHEYWEYVCDNVVRLDYAYVHDYFLRTIEIVKTRYQGHVLGKQQLKIYEKPSRVDTRGRDITDLQRQHPYITEGGIFIFPSIHYYLSIYKRRKPAPADGHITPRFPKFFSDVVQYPKGRCTAFVGQRGGHKSHLAYLSLLCQLIDPETNQLNEDERGLIISLRDDEEMTLKTMNKILEQEFRKGPRKVCSAQKLVEKKMLEILYYRPGYITPEEFFHRMFLSIHRLKQENHNVMVIFNSLDQLTARFPLCVKQEIFIPSIIDTLNAEEITSIFIAVDEPDQPIDKFGLIPMADLILSFNRRCFPFDVYMKHLTDKWENEPGEFDREKIDKLQTRGDIFHEAVVLEILRASGGKSAGEKGLLELIQDPQDQFYSSAGLHFTPMSHKYGQGYLVNRDGHSQI